ncbi:MAG: MurT ligase domain-containing protein [Clostridia bacterium]|nr:MurT ligase domain-containing protein [Clostridia bacterium]
MRFLLAKCAAHVTRFGLRLMRRGATTLPGKIALKIDSDVITKLSKDKFIITVTGTNGKTTTSHMISEMITSLNEYEVINNISGANLASGIATTLICNKPKNISKTIYVLETDEAAFAKIAGSLQPKLSVVTNLFRDQLDRYGELTHTRDLIASGIDKNKARIILNSDDSLVASLGKGREDRSVFFGMDKESMRYNNETYPSGKGVLKASSDAVYCPNCQTKYEYKSRSFSHLGDFYCPTCGFSNPGADYRIIYDLKESPSNEGYIFKIANENQEKIVSLVIPGMHNLYNTCAAVACVREMLKLKNYPHDSFGEAIKASSCVKPAFGRMEKITLPGFKKLCILLVKNPAGLDRSLSFVSEASDAKALMFLLNSNTADGKDVSWIWDVDFESKVSGLPNNIYVSGERYGDMLLRVNYSGVEESRIKYAPMDKAVELLKQAIDECEEGGCVYVLPNYTSMLDLRGKLVKELDIKDFWK